MDISDFNRYDWVQLVDPKSQQLMYINLKSGECSRDPPKNTKYKAVSPNQWWELFDVKVQRNYYYNSSTRETVWEKPVDGDIIPLAKIQLLQQNLQPSSSIIQKSDMGVLRRSNNNNINIDYQEERLSTSLNQRKCTNSFITAEIPDYSFNNMVVQQVNISNNKLNHYPMPISTNNNHNHSAAINETMNSIHSPLSLLSRPTVITDIPNTSNTNHVSIDNQRVRDWLRDAVATTTNEMKSTVINNNTVIATTTANNNINEFIIDNSNTKKPGCLSDRPIRRHNIQSSQLQGLIEFPAPSEDQFPNLQFKSVSHSVNPNHNNSVNLISVYGSTYQTSSSCSTSNYPIQYDQNVPCKFIDNIITTVSSESTTSIQKESDVNNSDESITDIQQITNLSSDKSFQFFNSSMCEVVKQSSMPPTISYGISQPVPRQRAFPRTNPTISRPSGNGTCTLPRPCTIPSEGSPISLFPSVALSQFSDTSSARASITDSKIPIIHGSDSKDSSSLIKQKLIEHVSSNLIPEDISNSDNTPECIITSSSQVLNASLKVSCSVNEVIPSYCSNKYNIKVSSGNYLPVDSPLSASPHPSSSPLSPTSFSSASSATALTTANSEESIDMPNSMMFDSENWNVFSLDIKNDSNLIKNNKTTTSTCLLNTTTDYSRHFPTLDESLNEEEDYLRPPTPPPRSASTLCSPGMPGAFFVTFPNHISLNTITSFDQTAGYIQINSPYSSQPCPSPSSTPITNLSVSSSLSRNHPSRAHVIQPNSRRTHRSQYYTQQIHTDLHSLSNSKEMQFSENSVVDPACFIPPTDSFNSQQPRFIMTSQPNIQLKSTDLPNAVVCSTNGGANVWNTKNITIWDGSNCFKSNTNESIQIVDSNVSKTAVTSTVVSTTTKGYSTANLMNNFPRSASGGFIGPAESTDSSSVWTCGSYNNNNNRSRPTTLRKSTQQIYVHPGHPAFSSFIGPFDWPSHLFKADQDIFTLMSWTKSNFSKRILISSEPSLKKQVAQLFKVIQSFMGDRKARLSLPDYGSIIIHRALSSANLRDELYAQLCKQTTSNPDVKSLTNGWALLCVCLYYFPPNSKFRDHLYAYLQSRADASVILNSGTITTTSTNFNQNDMVEFNNHTVSTESSLKTATAIASGLNPFSANNSNNNLMHKYQQSNDLLTNSKHFTSHSNHNYTMGIALGPWDRPTAAHFARVAPRWFVRSLNVGVRKTSISPSIEEICHVKDFLLKPCVFGSSLDEMMQIQAYRFPHLRLPWIQIFLTEEILRLNGARTEGIFRLSPDMDLLIEVRCQLEKLFEIFRVVQLCDSEQQQNDNNYANDSDLSSRFLVHRPPPSGWSTSARVIEAENNPNSFGVTDSTKCKHNSLLLSSTLDWNCLTGDFSWPILPEPLSLPPAEYVLLTPTAYWPRTLSSIIKRACSMSSSTPLTSTTTSNNSNSTNLESHLAAGLLKLWLRELSQPLIPVELQPMCLKAACEAEVYELQDKDSITGSNLSTDLNPIQKCCRLVRCLNPLPRRSLLYLILLLQHLSKPVHSNQSLMDARNLSTVIAPNIMRSSTSKDPRELLQNVKPQTLFIRLLITYLDIEVELKYLKEEEEARNVSEEDGEDGELKKTVSDTNVDGTDTGVKLMQFINNNDNNNIVSCNHDKFSLSSNGYVYLSSPVRVRLGPDNGFIPI
uniref:Putative mkiaa1688 protein n=1 Tax=Schistosoma mansoni TaxID=6183 RepID=A0A3Q0KL41_SCHMA